MCFERESSSSDGLNFDLTVSAIRRRAPVGHLTFAGMTTLEALPWPIAILDASGRIVTTNTHWRDAVAEHAFAGRGFAVGDEYAAVCDALARDDAREIAKGTRAVLAGTSRELDTIYRGGENALVPADRDSPRARGVARSTRLFDRDHGRTRPAASAATGSTEPSSMRPSTSRRCSRRTARLSTRARLSSGCSAIPRRAWSARARSRTCTPRTRHGSWRCSPRRSQSRGRPALST